jgi:hypothetical protein
LNSTAACVVNQDGTIIREADVPSEPAAIDQWLKTIGLSMERGAAIPFRNPNSFLF